MQIHLSAADHVPIYQQIVNQVKYLVASGRMEPGEELPPIRVLAERLVVNPNTVAQAYRELEREGVVYVRRGQGTFVADRPAAAPDRDLIVREVAARALLDAHRHGLSAEDLIAAVRDAADTPRAAE